MITVHEYMKMLDGEVSYKDEKAQSIRRNVEKYMLRARRAATNAKILETLLA